VTVFYLNSPGAPDAGFPRRTFDSRGFDPDLDRRFHRELGSNCDERSDASKPNDDDSGPARCRRRFTLVEMLIATLVVVIGLVAWRNWCRPR